MNSSVYATSINSSASVVESSDDNCAISMTVAISNPLVFVNDPVQISWNATVNRDSNGKLRKNKFGMEALFTALDDASHQKVQVVFSRLQTCTFGVDCDPVLRTSALLKNSSNAAANFTSNMASFSSNELVFSEAGSYSLIGHIILPGVDPTKRRYEFAVFTKVDVAKAVATSTAPLAESQSGNAGQKSQGMKTEVLAIIIIGAIAGVSLIVIGFTTLRTKGKPMAAIKKEFREGVFETNPGVTTVVAGGTVEENDFAMLSMYEMTMSSDRPRANTFLAALARGQAEKNKANPVNYVGPLCQQSFQRNVITVDATNNHRSDVTSHDDRQPLALETPLSSRDHMGSYSDMTATPKLFSGTGVEEYHQQQQRLKPTSHIMFNDIQEDEVEDDQSSRRRPAADLTEVSARIREHASQMLLELQEVESNSKRGAHKMTADDLRESVKAEQGRSLKLSDLGSVQQGLYRYSEDSNYD